MDLKLISVFGPISLSQQVFPPVSSAIHYSSYIDIYVSFYCFTLPNCGCIYDSWLSDHISRYAIWWLRHPKKYNSFSSGHVHVKEFFFNDLLMSGLLDCLQPLCPLGWSGDFGFLL